VNLFETVGVVDGNGLPVVVIEPRERRNSEKLVNVLV